MLVYGLAGASDFQTGHPRIPGSPLLRLRAFLSTFVQMRKATWASWCFKTLNRVMCWLVEAHTSKSGKVLTHQPLRSTLEGTSVKVPVHTQVKT